MMASQDLGQAAQDLTRAICQVQSSLGQLFDKTGDNEQPPLKRLKKSAPASPRKKKGNEPRVVSLARQVYKTSSLDDFVKYLPACELDTMPKPAQDVLDVIEKQSYEMRTRWLIGLVAAFASSVDYKSIPKWISSYKKKLQLGYGTVDLFSLGLEVAAYSIATGALKATIGICQWILQESEYDEISDASDTREAMLKCMALQAISFEAVPMMQFVALWLNDNRGEAMHKEVLQSIVDECFDSNNSPPVENIVRLCPELAFEVVNYMACSQESIIDRNDKNPVLFRSLVEWVVLQ